jgi:hypothetical protein
MELKEPFVDQGLAVQRAEYEERIELVVDFGRGADPSVDVVGDTVIVIAGGEQYETEVSGDAQVFISNGVLTIEVDK